MYREQYGECKYWCYGVKVKHYGYIIANDTLKGNNKG